MSLSDPITTDLVIGFIVGFACACLLLWRVRT